MTKKSKKLKWERVGDSFDLKLTNHRSVNIQKLRRLLEKVELPNPEYDKPFNKDASCLFRQWFDDPSQPLKEAPYTLLSNWFLTNCSARTSLRAGYARELWDTLFCSRPKDRFSDWRISGRKVVPCKFERWWKKQQKCQGERDNSVKGRVISAWKQANKPNWSIEQTLKVCVRIDSEFEEAGLQPAPRFRDAVKYLVNWVQGCHFPWLNPR